MKLTIQIPCFNESAALPMASRDLPRSVAGFDSVEYLVVDDGSTDGTAAVARSLGVHHVLQLGSNRGLATAFRCRVEGALQQGADVLVNVDGDNQYCAADIPRLEDPVLVGAADMVVGCRPIGSHPEFGLVKKVLQKLGSWALRQTSRTGIRDAASEFRAFRRGTCLCLFVYSQFSYCMETLIQAGNMGLRVGSAGVRINPSTRESRLFRSVPQYIW